MAPFLTLRPVIEALEDGRVIRMVIASLLRIAGVFVVIATIGAIVVVIRMSSSLPIVFVTVMVLTLLGAAIGIGQVLLHRASTIGGLGDSTYTVIPIVSTLLRAAGEVYAVFATCLGVGGALALWLTKTNPTALLPWAGAVLPDAVVRAGASFVAGLLFLVLALAAAFVVLLLSYLAAETSLVFADIARNTRKLVAHQGPARSPAPSIAGGVRAVS